MKTLNHATCINNALALSHHHVIFFVFIFFRFFSFSFIYFSFIHNISLSAREKNKPFSTTFTLYMHAYLTHILHQIPISYTSHRIQTTIFCTTSNSRATAKWKKLSNGSWKWVLNCEALGKTYLTFKNSFV